ncbi:MAG: hypothetical protein C0595_06390 [Marinilabiliales bacterium]|nr:MAG: hypothetical protein C0595_06390 [Marinilabiliales bacterium]
MKLKIVYLITLFLFASGNLCLSQDIIKGSYSVGFNYYKTYDGSRKYIINNDTISRTLLIHFWYPSNDNAKKGSYYFKNYIDLISIRENFDKPLSEIDANSFGFVNAYAGFAKQRLGIDTSITTQQILDCPVNAQYGIPLAKSNDKFPLIIYATSNSKSSVQNHMICEFLASHGYMVISVGSAGSESIKRKNDTQSILAQVEDMEYILNYFEDSLKIKYKGLGLIGFSTGGLATTIFQMRNEKVTAVFSMDGSQEYGHYLTLSQVDDFDLKKTNVPYCLLVNNNENFSIYPFYNSIASNQKYMFRMPYLDHNGFVSFWRFFDLCSSNSNDSKICSSYDYIESTALAFFNTYLKTTPKTNSQSDLNILANEYIKSETKDNSIVAQLSNTILTYNIDSAIIFLKRNQEVFKSKENEINILSRMYRDSDMDAAVQLLLFNIEMHPDSWKPLYELAFTYKVNGYPSLAKETVLKAKQLNPENQEIIRLLNEINEAQK